MVENFVESSIIITLMNNKKILIVHFLDVCPSAPKQQRIIAP
jgi:hypothetical protein